MHQCNSLNCSRWCFCVRYKKTLAMYWGDVGIKNRRMKKYGRIEIWCTSHIHPCNHSTTHLVVRVWLWVWRGAKPLLLQLSNQLWLSSSRKGFLSWSGQKSFFSWDKPIGAAPRKQCFATAKAVLGIPFFVSVVSRLDMYWTYVLLYRTYVLLARPTKVRR